MAAIRYKCTNFANCDLALRKELIEIDQLDDFQCPSGEAECQKKYLQAESSKGKNGGIPKAVFIGVAALIVIGALAYLLWPTSPDPALADRLIQDYFPRLK